jgi:hypothetical protein
VFEDAFREAKGGVTVSVHVVPRASRTALAGMHGDRVRIRIKAPPVEGAANRELARFLGEQLSLPATHIELIAGAGSRQKLILVRGLLLGAVMARLKVPEQ